MTQISNLQKLKVRAIGNLSEAFHIPSYQRGYRWEKKQVLQLLNDIYENRDNIYYLQPIVVAPRTSGGYDLIDGQQRLTTIMLIYKAIQHENKRFKDFDSNWDLALKHKIDPDFSIGYDTRSGSADFINEIGSKNENDAESYPDYLYMWHAYQIILEWFGKDKTPIEKISDALEKNVKIIWYELEQSVDCWEKFADLNIGQIPLTNSELVKALFMRDTTNNISETGKNIIVEQWDSIERDLCNLSFWGFLTNRKQDKYDTKIDLLFDIIAGKSVDERDDYFTFQFFEKGLSGDKAKYGKKNWDEIFLQYLRLRDWYEDREMYHKIGYLVAINDRSEDDVKSLSYNKETIAYLFTKAQGLDHNAFNTYLDDRIRHSIDTTKDGEVRRVSELNYYDDYVLIERILTLFNVLSTNEMKDDTQRYSFYHHKNVDGGWSLEHIHAQKSDTLNKANQWIKWVELHRSSLKRFHNLAVLKSSTDTKFKESGKIEKIEKLESEMDDFLSIRSYQTQIKFNSISQEFADVVVLDDGQTSEYKDMMSNMALLSKNDNSMLNCSVFDVKRGLIMDKLSKSFIPICTQRVFLKAYTYQDDNQPYFWGEADRQAYIDKIEEILEPYLPTNGYVTEKQFREKHLSSENEVNNQKESDDE
jgi:uncharacterized protein with ParB-like and HNH nuclease domain